MSSLGQFLLLGRVHVQCGGAEEEAKFVGEVDVCSRLRELLEQTEEFWSPTNVSISSLQKSECEKEEFLPTHLAPQFFPPHTV